MNWVYDDREKSLCCGSWDINRDSGRSGFRLRREGAFTVACASDVESLKMVAKTIVEVEGRYRDKQASIDAQEKARRDEETARLNAELMGG